ncbi:TPA: class I SAM-dependent methyltransferase [Candidatus Woesearchaeota archaeon]|nr:class I SAM-dependent methyltransferase [Candidatus Woesearchaeota archaeon]HIJ02531.1 class I SAM-dependent methyltransferase [Candidatus Woesearchaeota archaeon]
MPRIIKNIIKKLGLVDICIKSFIRIHDISYRIIDELVILKNNNIHPKHRLMNYHDFFINNIRKDSTVLDIGCGIGAVAFDISKKASKVVAVDLDKNNLKIAREKFSANNIEYIYADATKYNFKDKFDYIIISNVLEHIKNKISFLKKIKLLAPEILIRVPMINRDWLTLYKKEKGLPYFLDNTHFIEYDEETFKKEMKRVDLQIKSYSVQFGEIWAVVKK